jgi:hypothetical protein
MYMVMLVLDVVDRLDAVLAAWNAAGVRGATIAETIGAYRRTKHRHVIAPYAVGGSGLIDMERGNYSLWAIVPDEETVQRCLAAAEGVVGDLNNPGTGVLAAWPLALVKGVQRQAAAGGKEGRWSG